MVRRSKLRRLCKSSSRAPYVDVDDALELRFYRAPYVDVDRDGRGQGDEVSGH